MNFAFKRCWTTNVIFKSRTLCPCWIQSMVLPQASSRMRQCHGDNWNAVSPLSQSVLWSQDFAYCIYAGDRLWNALNIKNETKLFIVTRTRLSCLLYAKSRRLYRPRRHDHAQFVMCDVISKELRWHLTIENDVVVNGVSQVIFFAA